MRTYCNQHACAYRRVHSPRRRELRYKMILTGDLFYQCGTTRQGNRHITYYYAHTVSGRDIILKPLPRLPDNEDGQKQWLIHYLPSMTDEYNFIYSDE